MAQLYRRGRFYFPIVAGLCAAGRILTGNHFVSDAIAGAWLGWEIGGLVWNGEWLRHHCNSVRQYSWYPKWNWDAAAPRP